MTTMKKMKAALLVGAVAASSVAFAAFEDTKFYVAGDLNYAQNKFAKDFKAGAKANGIKLKKNKFLNPTIALGARVHENAAIEVGFTNFAKLKSKGAGTDHVTLKGHQLHADVVGIMPISAEFDVLASAGLARTKSKYDASIGGVKDSKSKSKTGMRVGFGGKYNMDENVAVRAMYHYTKAGSGDKAIRKSTNAFGVGVQWTFA